MKKGIKKKELKEGVFKQTKNKQFYGEREEGIITFMKIRRSLF